MHRLVLIGTLIGLIDLCALAQPNCDDLAIWNAVLDKNLKLAQGLFDSNASLDIAPEGEGSPLHLAVRQNDVHMAEWLLSHGANRFVRNADGLTPHLLACQMGHYDLVLKVFVNWRKMTFGKMLDINGCPIQAPLPLESGSRGLDDSIEWDFAAHPTEDRAWWTVALTSGSFEGVLVPYE